MATAQQLDVLPCTTLLQPPKPLDISGDMWRNWKTWKCEFRLFSKATFLNRQPKEVQAATLLMIVGEDARKTFSTFTFASEDQKQDVDTIIEMFDSFYRPAANLTYEFVFGTKDQKEGELFNAWLTDIRVLANNCQFDLLKERLLRSGIILGIRDKKLQQKLVNENTSSTKVMKM